MPWYVYALISALFAGFVAVAGKIGLKGVDTTLATTIRSVVMSVFLILLALSFGKFQYISNISGKALFFIIISGIAGALSWVAYFYALKQGNVAQVAIIDRMSVVFAIVLAVIFLNEVITWKTIIAMLLIIAGGILMVV